MCAGRKGGGWGSTSRLFSQLPAFRRCNSSGRLCTIRQSLSMYKTSQPSSRRERNRLGKESDAPSGGVIAVFIQYTMLMLYDFNPDWWHILRLSHTIHRLEAPQQQWRNSWLFHTINSRKWSALYFVTANQNYIRDEIRTTVGWDVFIRVRM